MSDPDDPSAWLAKAENDLLCIRNNLNDAHVPWDAICFHAQQAAEKLLKTFLASHKARISRTHDLLKLLSECAQLNHGLEELREPCVLLNPYSVDLRYPGQGPEPSEQDGHAAVAAAERVRAVLVAALGNRP